MTQPATSHQPRKGLRWAAWVPIGVMCLSAYYLQPYFLKGVVNTGIQWFIAGVLLMGGVGWIWRYHDPPQMLAAAPPRPLRWQWLAIGTAALLLLIHLNLPDTGELLTGLLGVFGWLAPHIQFGLLVTGLLSITHGLSGAKSTTWIPEVRPHHLLLIAITLFGFFLRIWQLETGIHRFIDEGNFLVPVVNFIKRPFEPQLLTQFSSITAFSWMFPYFQLITSDWTGGGLAGLRLPSAVMGALTIPAVCVLAKSLFNWRVGLAAALILATFPPHLHFSRIGINNIADPLFGVLALWMLARGLQSGEQRCFALAGVCLGCTHYFYEGGRLFYTLFAFLWVNWLILFGNRSRYVSLSRRNLLVLVAAVGMTVLPLYYTWMLHSLPLFPRLNTIAPNATPALVQQIERNIEPLEHLRKHALSFVHQPDEGSFYGGETAWVLPVLVPLFLLGMGYNLWRIRTLSGSLLFFWVLAATVANAIISRGVDVPRYVVVLPAITMVMAVGLVHTVDLLRLRHRWAALLIGALLLGVGGVQAIYYYTVHQPGYYFEYAYDDYDPIRRVRVRDLDDMMFRAIDLPSHTQVFVVSPGVLDPGRFSTWAAYHRRDDELTIRHIYPRQVTQGWLFSLRSMPDNYAFFIEPEDGRTFRLLADTLYIAHPQFSPYDIPPERQLILYYAPAIWNYLPITSAPR